MPERAAAESGSRAVPAGARPAARLGLGVAVITWPPGTRLLPATGAARCGDAHLSLIERFNVALLESLSAPTDRQLVDVVAELLGVAADA